MINFEENIEVKGARVHNLKNIDVTIPRDKLVVITGISDFDCFCFKYFNGFWCQFKIGRW